MATVGDLAYTDMSHRITSTSAYPAGPVAGADKLWLSVWSGEVINAYDHTNMFESLVTSKTLSGGVAWEFPITGTVALNTAWLAGQELVGGTETGSTTIAVKLDKRPIAAHFEIDNIDLMVSQWEFRSELARQAGQTLANARDKQIAAYVARAACEDLTWTGTDASGSVDTALDPRGVTCGPVFISANFKNLGAIIDPAASQANRATAALTALQACEDFMVYLQTINAPTDGVYLAVTPRAFHDIRALGVARTEAVAQNMQPMFGGVAEAGSLGVSLSNGLTKLSDTLEYMGVKIIKSNHLPVGDWDTTANNVGEARYNLPFDDAGIVGLLFQAGCVASLKLQGLKVDTVQDVRRNTTFTVASMLSGTGVLRPELAAVLVGPTTANTDADTSWAQSGGFLFTSAVAVFAQVDASNVGGSEAAMARAMLRTRLGMTRECLATASAAFPYA
jgi:hypothetical protein